MWQYRGHCIKIPYQEICIVMIFRHEWQQVTNILLHFNKLINLFKSINWKNWLAVSQSLIIQIQRIKHVGRHIPVCLYLIYIKNEFSFLIYLNELTFFCNSLRCTCTAQVCIILFDWAGQLLRCKRLGSPTSSKMQLKSILFTVKHHLKTELQNKKSHQHWPIYFFTDIIDYIQNT